MYLNNLGNYIPSVWNQTDGCLICKEWHWELPTEEDKMPFVILAVFIERPTPFLQEVLERIYQINYPKSKLYLWIYNAVSTECAASDFSFANSYQILDIIIIT